MRRLRVAVIGGGHLGRIHARLVSQIQSARLIGVVDPSPEAQRHLARDLGVRVFRHHAEVLNRIDAAIIAAPSSLHHSLAIDCLHKSLHVFVEKPLATSLALADELVNVARQRQRVLQVGHVEQFNPAVTAVADRLQHVRFFSAHRSSGFTMRSLDVGVVLDLMIHDVQLLLGMVDSSLVHVDAVGQSVLSDHEDVATAWLRFANGCVAQLTASRISRQPVRQIEIHTDREHLHLDLAAKTAIVMATETVERIEPVSQFRSLAGASSASMNLLDRLLPAKVLTTAANNAILDELQDFIDSICFQRVPRVDGCRGRDAVATAERILSAISAGQPELHPQSASAARRKAA